MYPDESQLAISGVLDARRGLVFQAFTDPDHLATWWRPSGNTLPRDEIEFDMRPRNRGWLEALDKLDATLLHIQALATDAEL
jgi:uncharacterized protein YndB with AHSA1/START domain